MDIATKKKSRWLRGGQPQVELPELDRLLDFYWSGSERRISMLTVRIIGMNAIAMILLMIGILSLAKYQESLISTKLVSFDNEMRLIATALSESAIKGDQETLDTERLRSMLHSLVKSTTQKRIRVFDRNGDLLLDSNIEVPEEYRRQPIKKIRPTYGLQELKDMAAFILRLLPDRRVIPKFIEKNSSKAQDYPGTSLAMRGEYDLSPWLGPDNYVFLSGAAPLQKDSDVAGVILFTRSARDINEEIGDMWLNIVMAFIMTLVMTILVSIYLSGAITSPLRKLARTADGVRKGKLSVEDIPNYAARNDEIGELSVALRDMMNALWNRMDTIERFSADVAHELKNPLTSLKSAVETVSLVKNKKDREKLMTIIRHDIERMDRLISDIAHASRLDSELSRDVFQQVDVNTVLINLLDTYKNPLDSGDTTKKISINDIIVRYENYGLQSAYVWGLSNRLEQVFQNLLANALSFSKAGSQITISLYQNKQHVRVLFEDEGPGIPEKNLESIFERFYTERPAHESYGQHSGLGLSICKQIIKALEGQIYAENIKSADGKTTGARFTVILKSL